MIRDTHDYERHVDYVHYNPVKNGHVNRAAQWPHSSIHRYIAQGTLGCDWAEMKVDMASAEMIHVGTPIYGPVERNHALRWMPVDAVAVEYRRKNGSIAGALARRAG